MARLKGSGGNVKIATVAVAGIKEWTLNYKMNTQEVTGFDSSGHKEHLPTIDEWNGSFVGYKDGAPLSIGSSVAIELEESATANQEHTGNVIITDFAATTPVDGVVAYNYTFIGTGELTLASA